MSKRRKASMASPKADHRLLFYCLMSREKREKGRENRMLSLTKLEWHDEAYTITHPYSSRKFLLDCTIILENYQLINQFHEFIPSKSSVERSLFVSGKCFAQALKESQENFCRSDQFDTTSPPFPGYRYCDDDQKRH
uniref:Uncharacterized protein n=1 Tax=Romanomermis culicivorax TaxID=13658 RepID=A0A915ID59_ROMCU